VASSSIYSVLEKLGLSKSGGNHSYIKTLISKFDISIVHFTGQGYLKGKTHRYNDKLRTAFSDMLRVDSDSNRKDVKCRIIRDLLLSYCCNVCRNTGSHNNKELVLELDHINGINNDNRLENLRFLCPNCHSQTSTSSGKNNKK
jgi:5-methylcytosine-specific restriction endonuclease McrA